MQRTAVRGGWRSWAWRLALLAHLKPAAPLVPAFLAPATPLRSWGHQRQCRASFTSGRSPGEGGTRDGVRLAPITMMLASSGNYELTFGKYRGKKLSEVPRSYLEWMTKVIENQPEAVYAAKAWQAHLKEELRQQGPQRTQQASKPWAPRAGEWAPRRFNLGLTKNGQLALSWPDFVALNDDMKDNLSRIEGARFDGKSFLFKVESYDYVIEALQGFNLLLGGKGLDTVPASVVKWLSIYKEESKARVEKSFSKLSPTIREALLPFQLEGVRYALRHRGRVMIGDEMGLGKTVQGLAISSVYREEWPLLVLCPAALRLHWAAEIPKWLPEYVTEADVQVVSSGKDSVDGLVVICSYDLLGSVADSFTKSPRVILADESHYLKTASAKRTKACIPFIQRADRAILLTGTPALARPSELYSQLHGLRPKLFSSAEAYEERYCDPRQTKFGRDISGAANLLELGFLLDGVMIRREKAEVLDQLPSKQYQSIYVPVSNSSLMVLKRLQMQEAELAERGDTQENEDKRKGLMAIMREKTGMAKLSAACEYVTDLIEGGGGKVLVFAHHLKVLDGLERAMAKTKTGSIRIDGSVSQEKRQEMVELFKTDDSVRVAILGLTAASHGLSFTAASTVVFAELDWTPGRHVQAEDRAHRIGQVESVNIHYLIAKGTIDERIWESIKRKERVTSKFLDGHA